MDIQDIWNSPSDSGSKQDNWANFSTFDSDFSCHDPFGGLADDAKKSTSTLMETTESPQPNINSGTIKLFFVTHRAGGFLLLSK